MKKSLGIIASLSLILLVWSVSANSIQPLQNWDFKNFIMINSHIKTKINKKTWKEYKYWSALVKMNWWKYTLANWIDKNHKIDFSKFDMNWLSRIHISNWISNWIYIDWTKYFVEAIYQEFTTNGEDEISFNLTPSRAWTSDVELYIDWKYIETITPNREIIRYHYKLWTWNKHSILFKEVDSQNDWRWAILDNVVVSKTKPIHNELLNWQFENRITVKDYKKIRKDKNWKSYLAWWERSKLKYWTSIDGSLNK